MGSERRGEAPLLKTFFRREVVEEIAARITVLQPGFDAAGMTEEAVGDFPSLGLMGRARRIAEALRGRLPEDFPTAAAMLLASMGEDDGGGGVEGMEGFRHLPLLNFVGLYGLGHPEAALNCLEGMTRHFSAEFDIRPYLAAHPALTLDRMARWAESPDWRLRRLASEGARPRLPWGVRLAGFIASPDPCFTLLEKLKADPHPVVRRSVANHLNDLSKDHSRRVVETARRWLEEHRGGADEEKVRWIVAHGLRTLVKRGDVGALAALGFLPVEGPVVEAFGIEPVAVTLGEAVTFHVILHCPAEAALCIDYAIHHPRKNGATFPKVFKWTTRRIRAGERLALRRTHALKVLTTRRYYPGEHRLEVLVNGRALAGGAFLLAMPSEEAGG